MFKSMRNLNKTYVVMAIAFFIQTNLGELVMRQLSAKLFHYESDCNGTYGTLLNLYTNLQYREQCAAACAHDPACRSAIYYDDDNHCATNSDLFDDRPVGCSSYVTYMYTDVQIDCGTMIANGILVYPSGSSLGDTSYYKCNAGFYNDESNVTCQTSGIWGPGQCVPLATSLNGSVFRINVVALGKWWHYNPTQKWVTIKHQPNDEHVRFRFEEAEEAGLYKIQTMVDNNYLFDYNDYLSTSHTDDDYQRFWVYEESKENYRIITKATGSYVRVDEDEFVSSEQNKKDANSLYTLLTG